MPERHGLSVRLLAFRGLPTLAIAAALAMAAVVGVAVRFVGASSCDPGVATIVWVGPTGPQSWHNAANWQDVSTTTNRVPGATDHVCIGSVGVTVQHHNGGTEVLGVEVVTGSGLSLQDGSTLTLTDAAVGSSIRSLSLSNGGTLTTNAALSVVDLTQVPGSTLVNGSGDITVTGSFGQGSGGVMSGTGTTTIASGASWTTTGSLARPLVLAAGATGSVTALTLNVGGSIANDGTIAINGSVVPAGSIVNTGTLTHASGYASISASFTNSGTVQVTGGTLGLGGGSGSSGSYQVSAPAILEIGNGTHSFAATSSITGSGSMTVINGNAATFASGVTFTLSSITLGNGGTLTSNTDFSVATLDHTGSSTINGSGNITVTGTYSQLNGTMSGTGTTTIATGGTWSTRGALGRTLQIAAGASGTIESAGLSLQSGGTIANAGTLNVNGSIGGNGFTTIDNAGVLVHASGTHDINANLTNTGSVRVTGGTLNLLENFGASFTNYGDVSHVLSGGTYELQGRFQFVGADVTTLQAAVVLDGPSSGLADAVGNDGLRHLVTNGASGSLTLRNGRNFNRAGAALASAGTITVEAGSTLTATSLSLGGGFLRGDGTVASDVTNTAGTVAPGLSPGLLTIDGTYSQATNGRLEVDIAGSNPGAAFDRLVVIDAATLDGALTIVTDASFSPPPSSTYEVLQGATVSGTFAAITGDAISGSAHYVVQYGAGDVTFTVVSDIQTACNLETETLVWKGGTGQQSWHVAANWHDPQTNAERLPTPTDHVCIGTQGAIVQHTTGPTTVATIDVIGSGLTRLQVTGSSINITADGSALAGLEIRTNGLVTGNGDFSVSSLTMTGGTLSGEGTTSAASWFASPGTLDRQLVANGFGSVSGLVLGANGKVVTSGPTRLAGAITGVGNLGGMTSTGTLTVAWTAGLPFPAIGVPFTNDGSVVFDQFSSAGAHLRLTGGGSSSGDFHVPLGNALDLVGGTYLFDSGASIDGAGSLSESSGASASLAAGSELALPSVSVASGSVLTFDVDSAIASLNVNAATIAGTGDVTVTGSISMTGATVAGPGLPGALLSLGPTATLTIAGANTLRDGRTLDIAAGATATLSGTAANVSLTLVNGAQVTNEGTFALQAAAPFQPSVLGGSTGGTFINRATGVVSKSGAASATIAVPFTNDGTIRVDSGTLVMVDAANLLHPTTLMNYDAASRALVGGAYELRGTLALAVSSTITTNRAVLVLDGPAAGITDSQTFFGSLLSNLSNNSASGTLTIKGGKNLLLTGALTSSGLLSIESASTLTASVNLWGGSLEGAGTIAGSVTNSGGVIRPGASPGILTITGSFNQLLGGLEVDVAGATAGTGYDRLVVQGNAQLGGSLTIITDGSFAPALGDSFQVLTSPLTIGTFLTVQGRDLDGPLLYDVLYGPAGVTVSVAHEPGCNAGTDTITWFGGSGGHPWQSAANWSDVVTGEHRLPGASDHVCIGTPGAIVSLSGTSTSVRSVTVASGASLSMTSGATLTISDPALPSVIASLTQDLSTITGTGALVVTGILAQGTGSITGTGSLTIQTGATWAVSGGTLGRPLQIETGSVGTIGTLGVTLQPSGSISNRGSFVIGGSISTPNGSGGVTNSGTISHSANALHSIAAMLSNSGTVNVTAGELDLAGGSATGAFNVTSGARLVFGGTQTLNAPAIVTGGGTLEIGINGQATINAGVTVSVPELNVLGGAHLTVTPNLTLTRLTQASGSILDGPAAITVSSNYVLTNGSLVGAQGSTPELVMAAGSSWTSSGGSIRGGRQLHLLAGATGTISGALQIDAGGAVVNDGTITFPGATAFGVVGTGALTNAATGTVIKNGTQVLTITAPFSNAGLLRVNTGRLDVTGAFSNYNGSARSLVGGRIEVKTTLRFAGADVVTLQAALTLDGTGAQILDLANQNGLRNFTTIGQAGSLTLAGNRDLNRGTAALTSGGTLVINAGSRLTARTLSLANGVLQGGGTIAADVANSNAVVRVTSQLTISGAYIQTGHGRLEVDISTGGADLLSVTGTATLGGILAISTSPAWTPSLGTSYRIIAARSVTGTFSAVQGTNLGGGRRYAIAYDRSTVTLTVG